MRRNAAFRIGFLFLVATAVSCSQSAPPEPLPLTTADAAAIDSVFAHVAETLRAKDWNAFIETFDDNIVFQPANSPQITSKGALWTWIQTGPAPAPEFGFSNVQVFGRGAYAFATTDVNLAFEGVPPDQGKQLVVFRRNEAGEWKTIAVSYNSNTPLPASN